MPYDFYAPKATIDDGITRALSQLVRDNGNVNKWPTDTAKRLQDFMAGGKRIRGLLAAFSYYAAGGTNPKTAERAGAALELLHAGLLIHDDIMDDDTLRRGVPSLFYQYVTDLREVDGRIARETGKSLALCVGDALYFQAFAMLADLRATSLFSGDIVSLAGQELAKVAYAQMEDVYLSAVRRPKLTEKKILNLCRHKTARYTFSLPLMIGAMLGGASENLIKSYAQLGEDLGLMFQIKDDELGLFGSEAETGKPVGSDIRGGKKTLYYLYLYERASTEDKRLLDRTFGNEQAGKSDIEAVRGLVAKYDIDVDIEHLLRSYETRVQKAIKDLSLIALYKEVLWGMCRDLLKRTS